MCAVATVHTTKEINCNKCYVNGKRIQSINLLLNHHKNIKFQLIWQRSRNITILMTVGEESEQTFENTYAVKPVIKCTQGNLKMCPLWTVICYIEIPFKAG